MAIYRPAFALSALRMWLTGFLGIVGILKGMGMLPHTLSRLAGPIEAVGAVLQLPAVAGRYIYVPANDHATLSMIGGLFFMAGLGLIVSTEKAKSPICWSHAFLTWVYLYVSFPRSWSAIGSLLVFATAVATGKCIQSHRHYELTNVSTLMVASLALVSATVIYFGLEQPEPRITANNPAIAPNAVVDCDKAPMCGAAERGRGTQRQDRRRASLSVKQRRSRSRSVPKLRKIPK
jgi:hypothetical protein